MTQAMQTHVGDVRARPRHSPRLLDESIMKEPRVAAQFESLLAGANEKGVEREVCGILEMYLNAMGGTLPLTLSQRLQRLVDSTPKERSVQVLEACHSLMRQSPMAAEDIPVILADVFEKNEAGPRY